MKVKKVPDSPIALKLICAECGKAVDKAVAIEGYDYHDPLVCADCLREALRLLGEYPERVYWTPWEPTGGERHD